MDVHGIIVDPETGEGSIELSKILPFLSRISSSHPSLGRIFFRKRDHVLPNGHKVQFLSLKKESMAPLQQ